MDVLTNIPFSLNQDSLFKRCLIEEESEYAEMFKEIIEEAKSVANPKAISRELFIDSIGEETVSFDGVTFTSRVLCSNLENVERVFPYVVTCGRELDKVSVPDDDFLKKFWLEEIKATILESSRTYLKNYLNQKYSLGKSASMSPGSGDVNVWSIEQQKELFSLFGDAKELIGVELTDSYLMVPIKSLSGLRFQSEVDFRSCMLCHRENCEGRTAPFHEEMWDSLQEKDKLQVTTAENKKTGDDCYTTVRK